MELPPSREDGRADNATKSGLREGEQGRHRAHASYSRAASSRTSPSSSMVSVMRLGRQQTAQSSVKVCRRPPLGSTKTSLSSPQNAQLYVTPVIVRAMMAGQEGLAMMEYVFNLLVSHVINVVGGSGGGAAPLPPRT